MPKTLSEQLDELHEKGDGSVKKCEHGHQLNKCVPCALLSSKNRKRTNADFDREKRDYHKIQEINDITRFGQF